MSLDSPKLHFSGDQISALRGCWPLIFLHALEIDQGLLAHTGTRVPPKNLRAIKHVKFGLKFRVLESITLGIV